MAILFKRDLLVEVSQIPTFIWNYDYVVCFILFPALIFFSDVNGIIQGEFGFITADGVYHVTVYATDENGNFRILSMKNIRISARK